MKIQRKWRRAWQKSKSYLAMRAVIKKNKVTSITTRLAKKLLPPVATASLLLASMTMPAYANPSGGQITSGAGSIAQSGNTMTVTQNTNKMSVNWQSFNIAANETVNFVQPGLSSIALNRVIGNTASSIYGHLNANGQVFLINPNGVLFASGAQVNVGGLVASTLNLADSDFQAGKYKFSGNGGTVVNQGTITAANGGYVALLGSQVSNQGVVVAKQGTVALGAGNAVTMDMNGDGLLSLAVNQSAVNALTENKNLIQADGGTVIMTARAANALAETVVNDSGVIRARSISDQNGVILLDGGASGLVSVSGTLDASGKSARETGGMVKVLGDTINISASAKIDIDGDIGGGSALIGGNSQGKGPEQNAASTVVSAGATISADALTNGNGGKVVVWANGPTSFKGGISARGGTVSGDGGNIEVSGKRLDFDGTVDLRAAHGQTGNLLLDPYNLTISGSTDSNVSGTSAAGNDSILNVTTLTNILASANVTVSTGTSGSQDGNITVAAPVNWSEDTVLTLLAAGNIVFNNNLTATGNHAGLVLEYGSGKDYLLNGNAITLSGANASLSINSNSYTLIHSLTDLNNINTTGLSGNYALAGDLNANGNNYSTALVGTGPGAAFTGIFAGMGHTISNLTISATADNAGLFGYSSGTIRDVSLTGGDITSAAGYVGGLVGYNAGGTITNSYYSGAVQGFGNIGGLVGCNNQGTITYSHSAGTVHSTGSSGVNVVGGLVGSSYGGTIDNSYSESTVTSIYGAGDSGYQNNYVTGGLVGGAWNGGTISNSYSTGTVNGSSTVGGLVGVNYASVDSSHTVGAVNATSNDVGGLVGVNYGAITNSYSDSMVYATVTNDVNAANASNDIGGLVGTNNTDGIHTGSISSSHSTGNVQGTGWVGGLVGYNNTNASIAGSNSIGSVVGYYSVGGLAGTNAGGSITGSNSTGNVTGANRIGGLAGKNSGSITNSTSIGMVTRSGSVIVTSSTEGLTVGGLVGYNTGTISGSSSSGQVTSNDIGVTNNTGGTLASYAGGLVGNSQGTISGSQSTSSVTNSASNSSSGISAYYAGGLVGKDQTTQTSVGSSIAATLLVNGSLTLSNTNLSLVASDNIQIQSPISGVSTLTLNAGNTVSQTSAGTIAVSGLNLVQGFITLNNPTNAITTVAGSANSLTLASSTPLTVGTLGGSSGLNVMDDLFLTVAAPGGMLTVNNPVYRTSSAFNFGFTADRMAINAQVDQGQTAGMPVIAPYSTGRGIILGSTSDTTPNELEISAAEYSKIGIVTGSGGATGRNLQIGDSNTGAITITDGMKNYSADNQYRSSLWLVNNSTVAETGAGAVDAQYLVVRSNGAITLSGANKADYFSATSNNHDIAFHAVVPAGGQLSLGSGDPNMVIDAGTGNFILTADGSLDASNNASQVNIEQTITADGLALIGPNCRFWMYGPLYINNFAANVGTVAVGSPNGFNIGTVGDVSGITSTGILSSDGSYYVARSIGLDSGGTITQTAPINVIRLLLGKGNFVLDNANNHVEYLANYSYTNYSANYAITNDDNQANAAAKSGTGSIIYRDSANLLIDQDADYGVAAIKASGSVTLQGASIGFNDGGGTGINAGGAVTLKSSGNITLDSDITTTGSPITATASTDITLNGIVSSTGGDIVLAAGRNFINNLTTNTGIAPGSGRYFVYSTNPADATEGMTGYNKHYNQTYTPGSTPSYASSGNWFFYSIAPVLEVTPGSQTVTYGTTPGGFTPGYNGFIDGDGSGTAGISGTAVFSIGGTKSASNNYTAGSHDVAYTGGLVSSLGYQFMDKVSSASELTVNKALLMITANNASKTYDGVAYSGGNGVSYSGFINGETNSVLGGALFYSGTSQGAVDPGSYLISPEGLNSGNYNITYINGTLNIGLPNSNTYQGAVHSSDQASKPGENSAFGANGSSSLLGTVTGSFLVVNGGINTGGSSGEISLGNQGFRVSEINYLNSQSSHGLVLNHAMTDTSVPSQTSIRVVVPADTFATTDPNPIVQLTAMLVDGRPLPEWLRFDPASGAFTGISPAESVGELSIKVTARDVKGAEVVTTFKLIVGASGR